MLDEILDRFTQLRRHPVRRSDHRTGRGLRGLIGRILGGHDDDRDRRIVPQHRYERDDHDHGSYHTRADRRRWRGDDDDDDFDNDDRRRDRRGSGFDLD